MRAVEKPAVTAIRHAVLQVGERMLRLVFGVAATPLAFYKYIYHNRTHNKILIYVLLSRIVL